MIKTSELKPGQHVTLMGFGRAELHYRRKLLALGLTRGANVTVVRKAPFGCPIQLDVSGISLILRLDEAFDLEWEPS